MATWSFVFVSTISPALKSIQPALYPASFELEEIYMAGTRVAKGVPLPVVNRTIWAPDTARAVAATRSLPGADSRLSPFSLTRSPYSSTPHTGEEPDFWVQPRDLSSRVEMPPFLLPGEGFS